MKNPAAGQSSRSPKRMLSHSAMLGLIFVLIGSGLALLWNTSHTNRGRAQAADVSVVGPPTLSAGTINGIFERLGSPMNGLGSLIEQMSRQDSIDDAFALGVWWTETNDGEAGVGLADRNPGSVRGSVGYPSAWDGYTIYPSYSAAVDYWFNLLRSRYVDQGLSTVYAIARPYVGTTSYPLWAAKVINLIYSYRGLAPPPPAVTPTPKPTVNPLVVAANAARGNKMTLLLHWRANHSLAPLANQGTTQESARSAPASSLSTPPRAVVVAMLLLGLFTAIALVLLALLIGSAGRTAGSTRAPAANRQPQPIMTEPLTPITPLSLPAITPNSAPRLNLEAYSSMSSASPHRVTLRPVAIEEAESALVTAGSGGLLSRWKAGS